ncbi:hypothetical protein ACC718_38160, partial [Rhizobium ruizarguesonis]
PQDQLSRIKAEIADSFDEELEIQMEEDRLYDLVAEGMSEPAEQTIELKIYFRELFRLQHELVLGCLSHGLFLPADFDRSMSLRSLCDGSANPKPE